MDSAFDHAKRPTKLGAASSRQPAPKRAAMGDAVQGLGDALLNLAEANPDLALVLARLVTVLVTEAERSPRLARAIVNAVDISKQGAALGTPERRHGRRSPGPFDPFLVYAEIGEEGLRKRLEVLPIEQLRDIVAEQRMDHDKLAMKWRDPARLVERIVERVKTRSVKGDVFRSS
jgi:hypothetical protein